MFTSSLGARMPLLGRTMKEFGSSVFSLKAAWVLETLVNLNRVSAPAVDLASKWSSLTGSDASSGRTGACACLDSKELTFVTSTGRCHSSFRELPPNAVHHSFRHRGAAD